jgi:Arc/MetJ-type ribon-helix-helix transcriptional regulator
MTVIVSISEQAKADAEQLISEGHFRSLDEAIEAGLRSLRSPAWDHDLVDLDTLAPHVRAAVEHGLADARAGRVKDADVVFDRLIAKYQAMARNA